MAGNTCIQAVCIYLFNTILTFNENSTPPPKSMLIMSISKLNFGFIRKISEPTALMNKVGCLIMTDVYRFKFYIQAWAENVSSPPLVRNSHQQYSIL